MTENTATPASWIRQLDDDEIRHRVANLVEWTRPENIDKHYDTIARKWTARTNLDTLQKELIRRGIPEIAPPPPPPKPYRPRAIRRTIVDIGET